MRKTALEKRLARLTARRDALKAQGLASTDVNEVRLINSQLEDVVAEIEETNEELRAVIADEETRSMPANAQLVNGNIAAAFAQPAREEKRSNPYDSMEYREAFKAYVQRGVMIPASIVSNINAYRESLPTEQRAGVPITTVDTGAAIPLTIMREIINTVRKRYGNLYNKVRKTNVPGGVEYPIGALQATFKWINEATVSPRQKVAPLGKISFQYHTCEIRIAQTFLSQLLALDAFEAELTRVIAIAYLKAMDSAIVNGSGNGMPLGITQDARVTNYVSLTEAQMSDWTAWRKNFFAELPLGYRDGEFIFSVGTVDAYLETMADANNNPIFRQATGLEVNDGDARNPNGRFFGRNISLVEPDILPDFGDASNNDVIGIYWQPEEYAINENFGFTMRRYFDEETNEWVDKAIAVVDGKVLNPNGFWLIKKSS